MDACNVLLCALLNAQRETETRNTKTPSLVDSRSEPLCAPRLVSAAVSASFSALTLSCSACAGEDKVDEEWRGEEEKAEDC
jgi:hypothetical protein